MKEMSLSQDCVSACRAWLRVQNGQVDFIAATYSITDSRKEKVDFAGPYLITGQSLLVRSDSNDINGPADLENNKILCSVSGSTPAQKIKDEFPRVQLQQYDTYSACIEALIASGADVNAVNSHDDDWTDLPPTISTACSIFPDTRTFND